MAYAHIWLPTMAVKLHVEIGFEIDQEISARHWWEIA
jgi:hypothetical protein